MSTTPASTSWSGDSTRRARRRAVSPWSALAIRVFSQSRAFPSTVTVVCRDLDRQRQWGHPRSAVRIGRRPGWHDLPGQQLNAGDQQRSSVSVGPRGEFLVGWLDDGQGGTRVMVERFTAENPSVGIKAEGPQTTVEQLAATLGGWLGKPVCRVRAEYEDSGGRPGAAAGVCRRCGQQQIHQLDPDTAAIVHSIPLPEVITGDAGLAFAGNTLYLVSDTGMMLYELNPASGAIVDTILLADLGITESINGLAYLNGQVVAQAAAANRLYFIDPFHDTLISSVTVGASLAGGLAGAGSRGTLFAVVSSGDIVEIDPADGSVIHQFATSFTLGVGLAFVEGYLWIGDETGQVAKLDPDTGAESRVVVDGDLADGAGRRRRRRCPDGAARQLPAVCRNHPRR